MLSDVISAIFSTAIGSLLVIIYERLAARKERKRTIRPILDHSIRRVADFQREDPFCVKDGLPVSIGVLDFTTSQWLEGLHIEFQPEVTHRYGIMVEFKNISNNYALKLKLEDAWLVFVDDDVVIPFVIENLSETYTSPNEISKIALEFIFSDEEFDAFADNTDYIMAVIHCSYCDIDNNLRHDGFPIYVNFSNKGFRHLEITKIDNIIGESSEFNPQNLHRLSKIAKKN